MKLLLTMAVACLLALTGCAKKDASSSGATTPAQKGPFQAEQVEGLGDPEVVIVNQTDLTITIELKGAAFETVTLQPKATEKKQLPEGDYAYSASAPSVGGVSGNHSFSADHRYTWTFVVKTASAPAK